MRIRVALLLLASGTVMLIGQVGRELVVPDDLREVELAREMYNGGDYIVPHLAGTRDFRAQSPTPGVALERGFRRPNRQQSPTDVLRQESVFAPLSPTLVSLFLPKSMLTDSGKRCRLEPVMNNTRNIPSK